MATGQPVSPTKRKAQAQQQQLKLPQRLTVKGATYELANYLGKGGYAVAFSARRILGPSPTSRRPPGERDDMVAVKAIIKSTASPERAKTVVSYGRREIAIMRRLTHPNVLKLLGDWEDENYVYLILELCPQKTLAVLIKGSNYWSNAQTRRFIHESALGCQYIHSKLIVHRDIKPDNLLLDQSWHIRIADFGLSIGLSSSTEVLHSFCGTLKYQAPEMVARKGYSFGVDTWALGCIAYRLYYGNAPFEGVSSDAIYQGILSKAPKCSRTSRFDGEVAAYEISLLKALLRKDPSKRLQLDTLLENRRYFGPLEQGGSGAAAEVRKRLLVSPSSVALASPSKGLDQMVACLEAISAFDANKRIRMSYAPHHNAALMPAHWITEWVDAHNRGFGYLFNRNLFGYSFAKDHHQMMLLNGETVVHQSESQVCRTFKLSACPPDLAKYLATLQKYQGHLLEQLAQEKMNLPEREATSLGLDQLPWLAKKRIVSGSELVAMTFHYCTDLVQLSFLENPKIFLFDGRLNSLTIIKNDKTLCLDLAFILDGHITQMMQNYVSECLKYIYALLKGH